MLSPHVTFCCRIIRSKYSLYWKDKTASLLWEDVTCHIQSQLVSLSRDPKDVFIELWPWWSTEKRLVPMPPSSPSVPHLPLQLQISKEKTCSLSSQKALLRWHLGKEIISRASFNLGHLNPLCLSTRFHCRLFRKKCMASWHSVPGRKEKKGKGKGNVWP